MIVERARAEVRADNIQQTTERLRRVILWTALLTFSAVLLFVAAKVLT